MMKFISIVKVAGKVVTTHVNTGNLPVFLHISIGTTIEICFVEINSFFNQKSNHMKKILFTLMLITFGAAFLSAQVPERVKVTFKEKYPNATAAVWVSEDGNYIAKYTDASGIHHVVVYNGDARVVKTEAELDMKEYPASVKEYYQKKYPDERNYHVWVITDESGNKTYYIPSERRGVRYYFDKTGNFMREEKQKVKKEMKEHTGDNK